jgi:hypothetical protein
LDRATSVCERGGRVARPDRLGEVGLHDRLAEQIVAPFKENSGTGVARGAAVGHLVETFDVAADSERLGHQLRIGVRVQERRDLAKDPERVAEPPADVVKVGDCIPDRTYTARWCAVNGALAQSSV